jgi:zinc/manganese transport system substrate-binding protein
MKKSLRIFGAALVAGLTLLAPAAAQAKLNVVSSYPYISSMVNEIAGNKVNNDTLASGAWDPHFIVAKPSLILKLRKANLLIINGAQQEIGWMPPLLQQSRNNSIQSGQAGLLDLSAYVKKIQVPANVDRSLGDVHPQGNPHFALDPDNIPRIAAAVSQRLCQLDQGNCASYRQNTQRFKGRWKKAEAGWAQRMKPLKGQKVVQYHRLHDYFLTHYGLNSVNTLEPLPGIPPTPQHLNNIIQQINSEKVKWNLRCVYQPAGPSQTVSAKTQAKLLTLPHDVNAVPAAKDLFGLYEAMVQGFGV